MPIFTISSGLRPSMRRPWKWISPFLIFLNPVIARRIDDLPAPFAPIKATVSPSSAYNETPFSA